MDPFIEQLLVSIGQIIISIISALFILFMTIALTTISIRVASSVFEKFGYTITEKKQIKESDAISYFLQALIAVLIAFYAFNK